MSSRHNIRSLGLSRYDKPARLLQTINTQDAAAKPAVNPARNTKKRIRIPKKEVDVSGPPVSSDNSDSGEDEQAPTSKAQKSSEDPISSDHERDESPDRGDIQPSTFPSSWTSTASFSSSNRSKAKYGGKQNSMKPGSARSSQESRPSSQKKWDADAPGDELGPVRSQSLLRDPDKTYGSQTKRTSPSSPRPPRENKRAKKPVEGNEARSMWQVPCANWSYVEPARRSPPRRLMMPEDMDRSPKAKTRRPALNFSVGLGDTPSPERPARKLRAPSGSPRAPPVTKRINMGFLGSDDDSRSNGRKRLRRDPLDASPKPSRRKSKDGDAETKTEPVPTDSQVDLSFDIDSSSLSELSSSDSEDQKTADARCPYCKKPVDGAALQAFSKGAYMTVRMQSRFCDQHNQDEARAEWAAKGYPAIDWPSLDARVSAHHDFLEGILRGGRCHYGDILAGHIRAGRKRNLARSDFGDMPGYYGARGSRAMQEGIFARFSDLIRQRTVEDRVVSGRGHLIFVQAVLVPELAVRLVMEDMGVGEEDARRIMQESVEVGRLLCDEEEDDVDEDDENQF